MLDRCKIIIKTDRCYVFSLGKPKGLLGIDISSTAVKLVELRKKGKGYNVESYAVVPLPEGSSNEDSLTEAEPVSESIKKAIKNSRTQLKHCALAVPASMIVTKQLTVPASLPDADIDAQIRLEAEQYIPCPIDEVNLDYEVLGPSANSAEIIDVLLVATRAENVDVRLAAAEMAGLTVELVDVESHILEKVMNELVVDTTSNNLIAVVDYGAVMTNISVFEKGKLVFSQEQAFGGKQLTSEIMQRFGLTWHDAGLAKKDNNLPENYVPEVLEPFKDRMTEQLNRFLQLFYASGQFGYVDKVLLAGGCSLIPGIDEQIQTDLGITTTIVNPFTQCSLGSKVNPQRFTSDIPALMHAAGLSLRGFD